MTDLPDAVVNAAVEAFARKRNPKHNTLDHSETLAIRAALAAASGPWAEHLDARATRAEHRLGSVAKELGMDEPDTPVRPITFEDRRWDDLRKHVGGMLSERDALRAELDNLRDRVNALADQWERSARYDLRGCSCDSDLRAALSGSEGGGYAHNCLSPHQICALADNLSGLIPTEALGSPEERAAAKATSDHWERKLRAIVRGSDDEEKP